jgi:hypothetical protein
VDLSISLRKTAPADALSWATASSFTWKASQARRRFEIGLALKSHVPMSPNAMTDRTVPTQLLTPPSKGWVNFPNWATSPGLMPTRLWILPAYRQSGHGSRLQSGTSVDPWPVLRFGSSRASSNDGRRKFRVSLVSDRLFFSPGK